MPKVLRKVMKPYKREEGDEPLPEEGSQEWHAEFGFFLEFAMKQARRMAAEVGLPAELARMPGWQTVVSSLCPCSIPCHATGFVSRGRPPGDPGACLFVVQRARLKTCSVEGASVVALLGSPCCTRIPLLWGHTVQM